MQEEDTARYRADMRVRQTWGICIHGLADFWAHRPEDGSLGTAWVTYSRKRLLAGSSYRLNTQFLISSSSAAPVRLVGIMYWRL